MSKNSLNSKINFVDFLIHEYIIVEKIKKFLCNHESLMTLFYLRVEF